MTLERPKERQRRTALRDEKVGRDRHRMGVALLWVVTSSCSCSASRVADANDATRSEDHRGESAGAAFSQLPDPPDASASGGMFPCRDDCDPTAVRPEPLPRPRCPEAEPAPDAPCDESGLRCGYGDALVADCRRYYRCEDGWQPANSPLGTCSDPTLVAAYCPDDRPEQDSPCEVGDDYITGPCEYGDRLCYCSTDLIRPGFEGLWLCHGPPADPRCPARLPNAGEGCEVQALQCQYNVDCNASPDNKVFCFMGEWERAFEDSGCFGY